MPSTFSRSVPEAALVPSTARSQLGGKNSWTTARPSRRPIRSTSFPSWSASALRLARRLSGCSAAPKPTARTRYPPRRPRRSSAPTEPTPHGDQERLGRRDLYRSVRVLDLAQPHRRERGGGRGLLRRRDHELHHEEIRTY